MTSSPEFPVSDGADLAELRTEIDELKNTPVEELVDPLPGDVAEEVPTPQSTDAAGTENWNIAEEPEAPTE